MEISLGPLDAAVEYLQRKTPVTSALRTDGWERVALALRDRAQFSAGVENVRVMSFVQQRLSDVISQAKTEFDTLQDRGTFIRDLMGLTREEGISGPGQPGTIADIASEQRAALIYRQQTSQAYGYAQWQAGQDADALEAAPAQELVRLEERNERRNWLERWRGEGGRVSPGAGLDGGGRLVALKTDGIWARISRFGSPWPPYDFNSGVWVEDVMRDEAEALGLMNPEDPAPEPILESFNRDLEASTEGMDDAGRQWLTESFGDQVVLERHRAVWQGSVIQDRVAAVIDRGDVAGRAMRLGRASAAAIRQAGGTGPLADLLRGRELTLGASEIHKTWRDHGPRGERRADQTPLTRLDYELIPHVWREPDKVSRGAHPGTVIFEKRLLGRLVAVGAESGSSIVFKTVYRKTK